MCTYRKIFLSRGYKQLTTLDTALLELEHEKAGLRKRLSSLEKLNLYVDVLSYKLYEAEHDYVTDMEIMRNEKEELLARKDLDEDDLRAMLSEIDKRIQDRQIIHMAAKANIESKIMVIISYFSFLLPYYYFIKPCVGCRT